MQNFLCLLRVANANGQWSVGDSFALLDGAQDTLIGCRRRQRRLPNEPTRVRSNGHGTNSGELRPIRTYHADRYRHG